jgi:hypothetical protein
MSLFLKVIIYTLFNICALPPPTKYGIIPMHLIIFNRSKNEKDIINFNIV